MKGIFILLIVNIIFNGINAQWWWNYDSSNIPGPPEIEQSPGFFSVVGPRVIRAGENYECTVTNFNYPQVLDLMLTIQGTQSVDGKFIQIQKQISAYQGYGYNVKFRTRKLLPGKYELLTTSLANNYVFSRSKQLYYFDKTFSTFIQTDKPIYKPDDLVRFRVFVLDSETAPYEPHRPAKVFLYDPSDNLVNELQNVTFHKGVFESDFQLANAIVGNWKIKANVDGDFVTKLIKIDQYVLPKFQVDLVVPSDVLHANRKIPITIRASYTYGKALNGIATLSSDNFLMGDIKVNGSTTVEVDIFDDLGIYSIWYNFQRTFRVVLEDPLTRKSISAEASTIIHKDRYVIIDNNNNPYYTEDADYALSFTAKTFDGFPAPPSNLTVKYRLDYDYSKPPLEKVLKTDTRGIATGSIFIPSTAPYYISLEVVYMEVTQYFYIYRPYIDTASKPISIKVLTEKPKLDDHVQIQVDVSEPVQFVMYSIYSKGDLLKTKKVAVYNKKAEFWFYVAFEYAPESTIVVYYINRAGSVVSENIKITFRDSLPNYLNVKLSDTTVAPGKNVSLSVCTAPKSTVYFLALDKSVLLLGSGNDLSKNQIFDDLNSYNQLNVYFNDFSDQDNNWYYVVDNYENKFNNLNLFIISNGINQYQRRWWFPMYEDVQRPPMEELPMPMPMPAPPDFGATQEPPMPEAPQEPTTASPAPAPAPIIPVRKDFSESFLWESLKIRRNHEHHGSKGIGNYTAKVPDTLTSWVISAVSLNRNYGIGLLDQKPLLTVFMPFFIQLNLPYSVKRGEKLILEIFIRNYLDTKQSADVTFEKNDAEFNVVNSNGWKDSNDGTLAQRVSINGEDVAVLTLSIVPKVLGFVTLKIKAVSAVAGDAIEEKLRVIPEGIPQSISNASFVLNTVSEVVLFDLSCTLPENAVQDTVSVEGLIVGNVIGNALDNLGELIQMPYGCGEQNLLNFVPNIVIYTYLQSSNQLTQEIKDKIISFTQQGYQRQLNYRRSADGSFSAFGDSDASGSTWLTAYTLKAFVWAQNNNIITVDSNVISRALDFILAQQNPDGSFNEPGRVIHVDMQGESGSGVALTAYLAIVLTELLSIRPDLNTNLQKALNYIVAHVDTSDVYMLAISSYALELNSHPQKSSIINAFVSKAIESSSEIHWEKVVAVDPNGPWWYYQPRSVDIEITAYGLLLYLKNSNLKGKSIKVVKWLISKRNQFGGYSSSQDTVVGIEALSKFSQLTSSAPTDITMFLQPDVGSLIQTTLDSSNQMLVQRFPFDRDARSMVVGLLGTGFAVVQLVCNFYLVEAESFPRFNVEINFGDSCDSYLSIEICVSFIPDKLTDTSSMVLVLLDLPSGYVADQPDRIDDPNVKRIDLQNGGTSVQIYMDSLGAETRCIHLNAERQVIVENPKNSSVEVKDYYDSTKKASIPYVLPKLPACQ